MHVPDLSGFRQSEVPSNPAAFAMEAITDEFLPDIRAKGLTSVRLVAHFI